MTAERGTVKYRKPACSFCGAGIEEYLLIDAGDKKTFVCEQCVRAISALSKANPKAKRLLYPLKQGKK